MTVTAAPSRRYACASSMPTGPPPMTTRCSGRWRVVKIVSLVKYGTASRPGSRGTPPRDAVRNGREIDPRRLIEDAQRAAMPPHIGELRRGEQRFRRHAAVIE